MKWREHSKNDSSKALGSLLQYDGQVHLVQGSDSVQNWWIAGTHIYQYERVNDMDLHKNLHLKFYV